jgi:hypothetical protein
MTANTAKNLNTLIYFSSVLRASVKAWCKPRRSYRGIFYRGFAGATTFIGVCGTPVTLATNATLGQNL